MNALYRAGLTRRTQSISRWRAVGASLLSSVVLLGLATTIEAKRNQIDSELPPYKVQAFGLDLSAPVPVEVVSPIIGEEMIGMEIRMTFKVDENGNPRSIKHNGSPFDQAECSLGAIMMSSLSNWKFEPAENREGEAIAVKIVLPVKVVANGTKSAAKYTSIVLDDPVLVAILDR